MKCIFILMVIIGLMGRRRKLWLRLIIQHLKNASRKEFKAMKFYKKRWIQSGIILISSLGIVLSVFPSFADDNIDNLKGQTSALESELDGINKDILSLSEEISATEMQVEILNGEIARTSDALVEAEELSLIHI